MSEESQLPKTWNVVPLPIAAAINPPKGKIEAVESQLAHFVPMACVQEEFSGIDVSTTRPLREVIKGYTAFQEGDVLFAKITPCMENGKIAVVPALEHRWGFGSTEFHVLRATGITSSKWLAHYLSQASMRRGAQRSMTGSAGQLRVPSLWLNEQQIPIPPLSEQRRIVAKIEELFSDLDAGVAALQRAKANLKRYRASVLKAAVEGKLTEEWRAKHPAKEPASVLLARILKERRQKWEADQLAKFAAAEKEPPKGWKEKYVEPTPPDTSGLPKLPKSWCWASVGQLYDVKYGLSEPLRFTEPQSDDDLPVLSIKNVNSDGELVLNELKYFPIARKQRTSLRLVKGDLLFNWRNAPNLIGKTVIFDLEGEYVNASFLLRLRPPDAELDGHFVWLYLNYLRISGYLIRESHAAVNQSNFNASKTSDVAVPLPPLEEQREIVQLASHRFDEIRRCDKTIEQCEIRASRLRQSILNQAFEGKLVLQHPKDEPASVLLERLSASRSDDEGNGKAKTVSRTRGRRAKSKQLEGTDE